MHRPVRVREMQLIARTSVRSRSTAAARRAHVQSLIIISVRERERTRNDLGMARAQLTRLLRPVRHNFAPGCARDRRTLWLWLWLNVHRASAFRPGYRARRHVRAEHFRQRGDLRARDHLTLDTPRTTPRLPICRGAAQTFAGRKWCASRRDGGAPEDIHTLRRKVGHTHTHPHMCERILPET